jgi:hypothetical protein
MREARQNELKYVRRAVGKRRDDGVDEELARDGELLDALLDLLLVLLLDLVVVRVRGEVVDQRLERLVEVAEPLDAGVDLHQVGARAVRSEEDLDRCYVAIRIYQHRFRKRTDTR